MSGTLGQGTQEQNLGVDQTDLLADLAHELRTPLGGIDALTDLLLAGVVSNEQKRLLMGLKAASSHLHAIASHVIDGDSTLDALHRMTPVSATLWSFLEPISLSSTARGAGRNLPFVLDCGFARSTTVEIDPVRTRQMIENLIDNAFKVTTQGDIRLQVDRENEGLIFRVLDRGPGFDDGDLDRLFARRMQAAGSPKGTGIGLSLVKRYAEEAGGRCGASNRVGGGAELWFTLPHAMPSVEEPKALRHALVIEDSYAGRLLMRTMLEHFGFSVDLAIGAKSGIDAIIARHYDLITIDKMLGDSDGIDVTRRLRDHLGKNRSTRIIAVTGRVDDSDRNEFALAGADAFLPKPLSPRAMAEVLGRLGLGLPGSAKAA
jgi:CheY-like chemotaxis protein